MINRYIKIIILIFSLSIIVNGYSQDKSSLKLLFTGDIMGHDTQINAAYDSLSSSYNYHNCFQFVKPIFENADITICNLEVTLAGPPFKGYPQFSSPDDLAFALQEAGVDILATANNHSCDRGQQGLERTINILDSINMVHTGTFLSNDEREKNYPLMINQNNISIALLNYTYGTNGIKAIYPNIVNLIDTIQIRKDINKAISKNPDHIIVFMHWGTEYQLKPNNKQVKLFEFCRNAGADIIIGSHPHVLQKMEWFKDDPNPSLIVYSMGNFVSNQRTFPRDGGAMFEITFEKENGFSIIKDAGYYLTWVYPPRINNDKEFFILPLSKFEDNKSNFISNHYYQKMLKFADSSRFLLNTYNKNIEEIKW